MNKKILRLEMEWKKMSQRYRLMNIYLWHIEIKDIDN